MALILAFANGANDNYKGVATLFGSGTTDYKGALIWATITTFLGSFFAFYFATELAKTFTGAGLVEPDIAGSPQFILSVAIGASLTLLLATKLGFPISTTHSLTGALVGAGSAASWGNVHLAVLGNKFLIPLMVSPIIAVIAAAVLYPLFRYFRQKLKLEKETCVCVGTKWVPLGAAQISPSMPGIASTATTTEVAIPSIELSLDGCQERYRGSIAGISAQKFLDGLHFLSSGAVSFARGLNDTPKIAALLLAGTALDVQFSTILTGVAIMLGGLIAGRRVAHTVSHDITKLNAGQGFTANLVTSFLVIVASKWGVPVSTTHVSCGSLFGIGGITGGAKWKTIGKIVGAWIITLPMAGFIAAGSFLLLT